MTKEFVRLIYDPTSVSKLNKDPLNFDPIDMGRERTYSISNSFFQTPTTLNNIWKSEVNPDLTSTNKNFTNKTHKEYSESGTQIPKTIQWLENQMRLSIILLQFSFRHATVHNSNPNPPASNWLKKNYKAALVFGIILNTRASHLFLAAAMPFICFSSYSSS